MFLEVFFTQHFFICSCPIRQFFDFPEFLQMLIYVVIADEETFPWTFFRRC
jgi:hypothetical protein